ncbi:MAG: serine hydrolase [Candidatus Marinimicrobia bacterium]|nr:serine hydrolase [Candidatus Neomarinimicrobiota bacterium]
MNKQFLSLFIFLILFIACAGPGQFSLQQSWAERTLNKLTLREKIAQMMVYHMNMHFLNEESPKWKEIVSLLESDGIGGIHIWFGDAGTSLTLLNEIQLRSKIPVIVDMDIEYGLQSRFPAGTDLPPLMAIAATGSTKYAYEAGKISALEGRALGIHWNFAPVTDVNNNPNNPIINTRSFGEDPEVVGEYAVQFMKGLQDHGMLATAKHFPGHGDADTDSHTSLTSIPSDSSRLWILELKPFQTVIDAGVDAVMVAHVHSPDFQPNANLPATLSTFWVTDILRKKMGFKGVIVTDAMSMGGVSRNYSDSYALIHAINAGCDFILQNYNVKKSIDIVEDAVKRGIISEKRINDAALKMLKMKEKVGLHKQRYISMEVTRKILGKQKFKKIADEIAVKSITLVKNDNSFLPLSVKDNEEMVVIDIYDYPNDHTESMTTKGLKQSGLHIRSLQVDESDSTMYYESILETIPENAPIILNTFSSPSAWKNRIFLPDHQMDFIHSLNQISNRVLLISFGNPYLIQGLPETPAYICAWKGNTVMQNALVNVLMGKNDYTGTLPISIPKIANRGFGIQLEQEPVKIEISSSTPGKVVQHVMPYEIEADLNEVKKMLAEAVVDSAWPGAVLIAGKDGNIFLHEAVGFHTYKKKRATRKSDIFDLASITKVIATTSVVMKLVEAGQLNLDEKVVTYLPAFKGKQPEYFQQKSEITIKHLLTHTAGLPPFKQYFLMEGDLEVRLDSVFNTEPIIGIEEETKYSDVGLIILGNVLEKVSGFPLDELVDSLVFKPLGMNTTFYNPPPEKFHRIVPTEIANGYRTGMIHGEVHDENAHSLGGVAGHAGLFSTAEDLAVFAQMMLNGGLYGWKRIFKEETVKLFTSRANVVEGSSRCLGWDSPDGKASGGVYLSDSSFGHTGYTGTSLWIDPENQMFVILLTNAVHPNRSWKDPKYYDWRQRIHSAVYEAVGINEKNPKLKWRREWK